MACSLLINDLKIYMYTNCITDSTVYSTKGSTSNHKKEVNVFSHNTKYVMSNLVKKIYQCISMNREIQDD